MPNQFDAYREALVMETVTVWPDGYRDWQPSARRSLEQLLHGDPRSASHLEYIRTHTGFCRRITVTAEDIARLAEGRLEGTAD